MDKQNLWFLTLFSLILILGVYYITMPTDLLKPEKEVVEKANNIDNDAVEEVGPLVAMRVNLEEERQKEMNVLQEQLVSEELSSEEKNNVYEKLKYLNELQGKEEAIEKSLKNEFKLDCFTKIDNSNVNLVCISNTHDMQLANNIMRAIQKNYKNKLYITVKFQEG